MLSKTDALTDLRKSFVSFESETVRKTIESLLEHGVSPFDIIDEGLTQGIREIGEKFAQGECFLPELMFGAKIMEDAMAMLDPSLLKIKESSDRKPLGKIIMGTVKGDIHDIGKKIVATFLKLNGFDVFDIGMNVGANEFIKSAIQEKADIIGLSALLTTTMNEQKNIIRELENRGLRERFKVLVGGAPVTQEWADEISADAYGEDAIDAVKKVKLLLNIQDI